MLTLTAHFWHNSVTMLSFELCLSICYNNMCICICFPGRSAAGRQSAAPLAAKLKGDKYADDD